MVRTSPGLRAASAEESPATAAPILIVLLVGDDLLAIFDLVAGQIGGLEIGAPSEAARHSDQVARCHAATHRVFARSQHVAVDPDLRRIDFISAEDPHGVELLEGDGFVSGEGAGQVDLQWSGDENQAAPDE